MNGVTVCAGELLTFLVGPSAQVSRLRWVLGNDAPHALFPGAREKVIDLASATHVRWWVFPAVDCLEFRIIDRRDENAPALTGSAFSPRRSI